MSKKIIIATGGTGGHIFPAMALAHDLSRDFPSDHILFIGGKLESNRYFDRTLFPYHTIDCGSFVKKTPTALSKSLYHIGAGAWQSLQMMRRFKPDLVIGFGSFYSFPVLLGAKLASVPIILHEANSIPGKVIGMMSRFALTTGIHFPQTATLLKGKSQHVGLPLRPLFKQEVCSREEACRYFQLDPEKQTLLIFGGSQGANAINFLAVQAVHHLPEKIQVLHFTGDAAVAATLEKQYENLGIKFVVKQFEHRMELAWRAADIAIARAGAGTVAELMEFEVPSILIPLPTAADNHQEFNADCAVSVGGGLKLLEKQLTPNLLADAIRVITYQSEELRERMRIYKQQMKNQNLYTLVKSHL